MALALFLLAWLVVAALSELVALTLICAFGAAGLPFVGGYLMRADEVAVGRGPHLPFLRVEDDPRDGQPRA